MATWCAGLGQCIAGRDAESVDDYCAVLSDPGSRYVLEGRYELKRTLGSGASGKVKLAHDNHEQTDVALKFIDATRLAPRQQELLVREVQALQTVGSHPNILRLLRFEAECAYPKKRGGLRKCHMLAMELAAGGELFDFLVMEGAFAEHVARTYFKQLLSALAACHSHGIYHRDIKPENILLDADCQLKLADFGLSAVHKGQPGATSSLLQTQCGTVAYMAPEVHSGQSYHGGPADVWSAGIMLFVLLAGNPPISKAHRTDWWFRKLTLEKYTDFWDAHLRDKPHFPKGAMDLLNKMLCVKPGNRATTEAVAAHPWMSAGETLEAAALTAAMQAMSKRVYEAKLAQARARAARKRAAEAAAAGPTTPRVGASGAAAFDPYGTEVYRGVAFLPPLPPAVDARRSTTHFSHAAPDALLVAVRGALDAHFGATDVKLVSDKFQLKATVAHAGQRIALSACVYNAPALGEGMCAIEFTRRAGGTVEHCDLVNNALPKCLPEFFDAARDDVGTTTGRAGLHTCPAPPDDDDDDEAFEA